MTLLLLVGLEPTTIQIHVHNESVDNVFSKINLINNNNKLRITNAAKTFNKKLYFNVAQ